MPRNHLLQCVTWLTSEDHNVVAIGDEGTGQKGPDLSASTRNNDFHNSPVCNTTRLFSYSSSNPSGGVNEGPACRTSAGFFRSFFVGAIPILLLHDVKSSLCCLLNPTDHCYAFVRLASQENARLRTSGASTPNPR